MSGFGDTVAPRIETVSVNGAATASDVRRASTDDLPDAGLRVGGRAAESALPACS